MDSKFSLQASRREIGPQRIVMDDKLLNAVISGNKEALTELLGSEDHCPQQAPGEEEIAIRVSERDASFLLGVAGDGNTALHIVASRGHLDLAEMICNKEISLLSARNIGLDTPLHCAASAGHHQMVSRLIRFAGERGGNTSAVLRAKNRNEETALHEAARNGDVRVVKALVREDAGLASVVNDANMSPLYLAVVANSLRAVKVLLESSSEETASPAPPLLHAAVLRSRVIEMTKELLKWRPTLAQQVDALGRSPLHHAASKGILDMVKLLLQQDPSVVYLSDSSGLSPLHVAASEGNIDVVKEIIRSYPYSQELLDNTGRNFLHMAVVKRRSKVVRYVLQNLKLDRLLNGRDYGGNTPLHLAVIHEDQMMVHLLLRSKGIRTGIMNKDGLTPLDISIKTRRNQLRGLNFTMNSRDWIHQCLVIAGAQFSPQQEEQFSLQQEEQVSDTINPINLEEAARKHSRSASSLGISAVLIATVTFAAAFTMPGGYKDDGSRDRGTPILAKRFAFKAFLISDTLAFIFSAVATLQVSYAGSLVFDHAFGVRYVFTTLWFIEMAFTCMVVAFAMGSFVVLAPVTEQIGFLVCVLSLGIPFSYDLHLKQKLSLGRTMAIRLVWIPGGWLAKLSAMLSVLSLICSRGLQLVLIYAFIFFIASSGEDSDNS